MLHRLFPLILAERPAPSVHTASSLPPLIDLPSIAAPHDLFPSADIEERLAFGELPGLTLLNDEDRGIILKSFVTVHLEEEIRREALVKDWGAFVNFIRLAAHEWVGIEIWKRLQYLNKGRMHHFRTKDGSEVDFLVELGERVIPIEVKWTDKPCVQDATHLAAFLRDHPRAKHGYVVCRCPRPMKLTETITALPWRLL